MYSSFSARSLIGSVLQAHMNNQMTENGRPNGIFAGTDHLAIVIQEELEQMGLQKFRSAFHFPSVSYTHLDVYKRQHFKYKTW